MQTEQTAWLQGGCVHLELSERTSNVSVYGQLAGTHPSNTDIVATFEGVAEDVSIFGLRARGSSSGVHQSAVESLPHAMWFGVIADVNIAPPLVPTLELWPSYVQK